VVVAALAIPLLAPHAAGHFSATSALAEVGGDAVQSGATIERTPLIAGLVERPAQTIVVNGGDTVESLAATFHADPGTVRWANQLIDAAEPAPNTPLLVPPGAGALVPVQGPSEQPTHVAARLGLDPRVILDYNALRSDAALPVGSFLQVPRAAAPGALPSSDVVPIRALVPGVSSSQRNNGTDDRFPWGQCTHYVASKRLVTWGGDAWSWFRNAAAAGRPEGPFPVEGAIMVQWAGWAGHVAYVERVNLDGSWVVAEMNVRGVGVVDERTVTPHGVDLIGFIY
jgi:surface antigen